MKAQGGVEAGRGLSKAWLSRQELFHQLDRVLGQSRPPFPLHINLIRSKVHLFNCELINWVFNLSG